VRDEICGEEHVEIFMENIMDLEMNHNIVISFVNCSLWALKRGDH